MEMKINLFRNKTGFRATYHHGSIHHSGFGKTRKEALYSLVDLLNDEKLQIWCINDSMIVDG